MKRRQYRDCIAFPNTRIFSSAHKIGRGEFAGYYRGRVVTSERNGYGWGKDCNSSFDSDVIRLTRADALADALAAMNEAAQSGYVPPF